MLDVLPPELVVEIFRLCLPVDESPDNVQSNEAPLLLGRVCSSWRTAVVSTPMLWSTFHIDCKARTHLDNMKNVADLWFSRSGTHPLDVALVVQNLEGVTPLLSVLGQHAPHMRSLYLYTLTDDFKPLEVLQMDFRILERLAILVSGSGSVDGVVAPWPSGVTVQAFSSASTLFQISLHGSRIPLVCFALPWAHITHLDAPACGVGDLLQLLQHPPNLAHLFVTVDDWDGIPPGVISLQVRHSHLRTFYCRFYSQNSPSFLDCLIFPSLEALAILPSETSVPLSLDLLERSSARLKKLRLYPRWGMVQPLPDVSAFKQPSLSGLQQLDIISPASGTFEAFCNALASDPGFLPELRALAVGLREDLVVHTRQIVELVGVSFEKRLGLSVAVRASLLSLRVTWPPEHTVEVQNEPSVLTVQPAPAALFHIFVTHAPTTTALSTTVTPNNHSSAAGGSVASDSEDEEDRDDDSDPKSNKDKQIDVRSSASRAATMLRYIAKGVVLFSALLFWLQN
uniref:F-box domain-containing protein n=2 Tax=Mycena chlorophos TaxID=658473 RepID=A0ABQ0M1D6_MYCCL|nr:predicted protein [Mycena chlorophos]